MEELSIEYLINHWIHATNQWVNMECIHRALFSQSNKDLQVATRYQLELEQGFVIQHINAPVQHRAQPVSRLELGACRIVPLDPLVKIDNTEYLSKVIHVYQKRFLFDLRSISSEHYLRICKDLVLQHWMIKQYSKGIEKTNVHTAELAIKNLIKHWVHAANQWAKLECIHNAPFSQKIWTPCYELPGDIIGEITRKIDSPKDYVSFISTCKSWRSSAQEIIYHCPYKHRTGILHKRCSLPMLLQTFREHTESPYLYSISDKKAYNIPHHCLDLSKMWIATTYKGWLMTTDFKITSVSKINLLNPVTNLQIALPSCSSFKSYPRDNDAFTYLNRVLVVPPYSTADQGNCLVYATVGRLCMLHACRIGDDKWEDSHFPSLYIDDLTAYNGLLYTVDFHGCLVAREMYPRKNWNRLIDTNIEASKHYIVESLSGELLLISRLTRLVSNGSLIHDTIGFKVCKLVESEDELFGRTWKEIESLHGQILFVGYNGARCFNSSLYPGIEGNCIYFAHDNGRCRMVSHGNVGVYFMEDKRIEYFSENISKAPSQLPSIWFSPN